MVKLRGSELKVRFGDGSVARLGPQEVRRKRRRETPAPAPSLAPWGLPAHRYVLAPMVGGSELPFRMLCRKYGTQLCYTPMKLDGHGHATIGD